MEHGDMLGAMDIEKKIKIKIKRCDGTLKVSADRSLATTTQL